jgi:CRP-like cAMP-binding protein
MKNPKFFKSMRCSVFLVFIEPSKTVNSPPYARADIISNNSDGGFWNNISAWFLSLFAIILKKMCRVCHLSDIQTFKTGRWYMVDRNEILEDPDIMRPLFPRWCEDKMRDIFNENELFKGLDRAHEQTQVLKYPAGSFIFTPEKSTFERIYILKEGRIAMFQLLSNGKRFVTGDIQPGIVFGIRGVLGRTVQKNFAQAVEDCTVSTISKERFIEYLYNNPTLLIRLLEAAYWLMNILEDRLIDVTYNSVRSRLANFLLNNADKTSGIIKNITQEEIGDTVGATRQVVSENLSQMRKEGLLTTKRREIQVLDRRSLLNILLDSDD